MTSCRTSSLLVGELELELATRGARQNPPSIWRQPSAVPLDADGPDNPFDALPDDAVEDTLFDLFKRVVARDPHDWKSWPAMSV